MPKIIILFLMFIPPHVYDLIYIHISICILLQFNLLKILKISILYINKPKYIKYDDSIIFIIDILFKCKKLWGKIW